VLLGALGGATPLSVDAMLAALPVLTTAFATTADRVQLTISVFVLSFAVGQLVYGPLSDRFGRRPVLLGGLTLFTVGGIGCLFADSIGALVALRGMQGLGACVGRVMMPAIVRDSFEPRRSAEVLSRVGTVQGLAPMVAPVLGALLLELGGWRAIFVVLALYGATLLACVWGGLGETIRTRDQAAVRPATLFRAWREFLTNRTSLGAALCGAGTFAAMFSYISNSSFVLIEVFGVSSAAFGWLLALSALTFVLGNAASSRLVPRYGPHGVLALGLALVVAASFGFLGTALLGGAVALALGAMPVTFAGGLVFPNATAIAMAPMPHIAGVASSLLGAMIMATASLAAWLVGVAYDGTPLPMATGVIAFAALAASAWLLLVRRSGAAEASVG
jgi:DHA1 family bicyclomycin/chloramphenicol resistance-like MFS transporter